MKIQIEDGDGRKDSQNWMSLEIKGKAEGMGEKFIWIIRDCVGIEQTFYRVVEFQIDQDTFKQSLIGFEYTN